MRVDFFINNLVVNTESIANFNIGELYHSKRVRKNRFKCGDEVLTLDDMKVCFTPLNKIIVDSFDGSFTRGALVPFIENDNRVTIPTKIKGLSIVIDTTQTNKLDEVFNLLDDYLKSSVKKPNIKQLEGKLSIKLIDKSN